MAAKNANGSFAPVRSHCTAKWFVHGESYMRAVADAIEKAKYEIMITDWMFCAQIFLRRPETGVPSLNDSSRLDKMLIKKADEGVKVFLLIYCGEKKPLITLLDLGNEYSKELLYQHKNIVFILDPTKLIDSVSLWTHHEKLVIIDQTLAFVSGIDLCYGRWDNQKHRLMDNYKKPSGEQQAKDSDVKFQTWIGLDYMNDFKKAYTPHEFKHPFTDYIDRAKIPRLPWHDIGCCILGAVAKDVADHFKLRYKFSKTYQHRGQYKGLTPGDNVKNLNLTIPDPSTTNCHCQVLRSASEWSVGIETEHSIQNAYISAIENAEHFVYIENQFFISSLDFESLKVTNGIAKAIKDRIARAYKEKKKFRVILMMPLKPEFTGEIIGSDCPIINTVDKLCALLGHRKGSFLMQEVLNGELLTISRKKCSIIQRLITEDKIPEEEISQYFSVYGLRTYDYNDKKIPVTEIVYVHAKCMIVDDKKTIIGSANINDRSMKGDGDSEMVVCIQDEKFVDSQMDGQPYKAGEFAISLRLNLFREHLGIKSDDKKNDDLHDPLSDKFYKLWTSTAKTNDEMFNKVFGGVIVPCHGVRTYEQLEEHRKIPGLVKTNVPEARYWMKKVKGNLSEFPLDFLADTDMSIAGDKREIWSIFELFNQMVYQPAPLPRPRPHEHISRPPV